AGSVTSRATACSTSCGPSNRSRATAGRGRPRGGFDGGHGFGFPLLGAGVRRGGRAARFSGDRAVDPRDRGGGPLRSLRLLARLEQRLGGGEGPLRRVFQR